jgi:hypothetical protein
MSPEEDIIAELRRQNARLKEQIGTWQKVASDLETARLRTALDIRSIERLETLCLKLALRLRWLAARPITEAPAMMPLVAWSKLEPPKLTVEETDALKAVEERCPR